MGQKPSHPSHPAGETMKAVVFTKYGKNAAEQLELVDDMPKPVPKDGEEVLIRVIAAALNPIDKMRVEGGIKALSPETLQRSILGYDASGVVEVGAGKFKSGDEVFVRIKPDNASSTGTLSEYIVAKISNVALKPKSITFEEAASLPLAGVTALQVLRKGNLKGGEKVLITGGAGGVGTLAIQLAKNVFGAGHVATTASPGVKTDLVKSLGADAVINYRENKFEDGHAGKDFDFAFDTTKESYKMPAVVKSGGSVVSIAGVPTVEALKDAGKDPSIILRIILWMIRDKKAIANAKAANVEWGMHFLNVNGEDLEALARYVDEGAVKPILDNTWSFDAWKDAVERSFSGRSMGKCVVRVAPKPA